MSTRDFTPGTPQASGGPEDPVSKAHPVETMGQTGYNQSKPVEYEPMAVSVVPEFITPATINEQNREFYWGKQTDVK